MARYYVEPKATCPQTGKVSFDKKTALTKKNVLEHDGRERLRIYHCPYCNLWHLTKLDRHRK